MRLQSDKGVQLLGPVTDVGPVLGVEAFRDRVKALQAHHMVDPHVAGMAEGPREHRAQVPISVLPDAFGMKGREAPVLSRAEKGIGRGPAAGARDEGVR